jgi:hypothetical protein
VASDADTPKRARHMRSGGTVQRSSFTGDQPRLTALAGTEGCDTSLTTRASLTTEGSLATQAATGCAANTATGQPDANPATSSTGNGTASLATDAAAESSTRTTTDASLTTKAGTTAETGPGSKVAPTRPKARPELTPARPESTPTWPELTPTRSATGTGFARTPTRSESTPTWPETSSVPAETGLPTKPPRAPIPAISQSLGGVDEWGKGITHQRAAVLRHRRNEVRPIAVLVGQNLLQAADRVATEIRTRHGSRRRG